MVGHGHDPVFHKQTSAMTFLKHNHSRPPLVGDQGSSISLARCKMSVQGLFLGSSSFKHSDSFSSFLFLKFSHSSWSCCNCNVTACLWDSSSFKRSHSCVSCCTCIWSSSCFVLKLSHWDWICCICNACSCLFDSSSFKRSDSYSSCLFLKFSHSSWSCCICNACSCLFDSSSFKRSDSCSSCLFLKFSHSSWSCCICNATACLWGSSSFKFWHSCVSCFTCVWSSSGLVFKLASEVPQLNPQKISKKQITNSPIPTKGQNPSWFGVLVFISGSKTKYPIEFSRHFLQRRVVLLLGLLFQSGHQNAGTSVHGPELRQILGSQVRNPVQPLRAQEVAQPRRDLTTIPGVALLHGQLNITNDLLKSIVTCCQMLHGDVIQIHFLQHLVVWFE